ncbi:MAG TPA: 30S ribosomal protein S6 [Candidatus Limnocylindrales bacterium]|jgi:small subunit ribosomal protein S6|nr:30S ribosomal protein S6 [Candidatus Limnocylindrales bacterium]
MRRYELMLVLRPDLPEDRSQAIVDRITRQILSSGGQLIKVAPWGRRRLAYEIDHYRDGQYQIVLFEAPPESVRELERSILITEEVLRHLVVRIERPVRAPRRGAQPVGAAEPEPEPALPAPDEAEEEEAGERIDESESEAAPAAVD